MSSLLTSNKSIKRSFKRHTVKLDQPHTYEGAFSPRQEVESYLNYSVAKAQ